MYELTFNAEPFFGRRSVQSEISAGDRVELARSVVQALVRGGRVTDASRLTNVAFHIQHPDRDLQKPIDPATEAGLAREWKTLKSTLVMPALQGTGSATPSGGTKVAAGTKVLLVGDSHTYGGFGKELAQLLTTAGSSVVRESKIGTAVKYWLPLLPGLLRQHSPEVVIIALGANMRGYPSATGTSAQIRRIVALVKTERPTARVIWIGPPREAKDTDVTLAKFNTIIRNGLDASTTFIDSAPYTPVYRGGDGVHYNDATAKQWARGVFNQMAGK